MKKIATRTSLLVVTLITTLWAKAQNKGLDIDIDINKKEWYEQPWAWVAGGAILLLLIVLAARKRS